MKKALVLVLALIATLSVAGSVSARTGHHHNRFHSHHVHRIRGFRGTVTAVGSDSITLALKRGGSLTLSVTPTTKIRINGVRATLADVKVGFKAFATRARNGSARRILAKNPAFRPVVHGVVSSVGSDSLTLTLRNGDSLNIPVTSATKIHLKCGAASLADLQAGDRAYVKRNADGSARRIQAVQPHFRCLVHGAVGAVGADSITLTHQNGFSLIIAVTPDSKIYVNGAAASLGDIQAGYVATVRRNNDGSARRINAHPAH